MNKKTCSLCKINKPLDQFGKHSKEIDGLCCWCKQCKKKKDKLYYEANKESILARNEKAKKLICSKKLMEYRRKWKSKNFEKVNSDGMKRYARKTNQTPAWLGKADYAEIDGFYLFCKVFNSYKTVRDDKLQVDHIVPIRGKKVSGMHVPWNLQVITSRDNVQKSSKFNPSVYHQQGRCAFIKD